MKTKPNPALRIIAIFIFCCMNQIVQAGNFTWNGTINNSWSNANNWSPTGTPGANDTINIYSGKPDLELDQDRTVNRIVHTGSTINLDTNELYVTQRSTFNGGNIIGALLKLRGTLVYFQGTDFDCALDVIVGQIKFSGGTFDKPGSFEHNGGASGWGEGGCVFNDTVTIKNTGATYLRMGQNSGDVFNSDVTFISAGVYTMQLAYGDTSTFNGNVYINCTGNGGLSFCAGTGAAALLASGKSIGAGNSGLTTGVIALKNILQTGSTSQMITVSGTGTLNMNGCSFDGAVTLTAPSLLVKQSNFNSTASFTKTGNAANHWDGGNTFNGTTTITNGTTGSGVLRMALQEGDVYAGDITFNTNTGYIQVAFSDTNEFKGDITLNSSKVTFNNGNGIVQCTGGNSQAIGGNAAFVVGKLWMNKSTSTLTLQKAVTIDSLLTLTSGIIYTDSTNLLTLKAGGVATGASDLSYIDGPLKKIGNTAFVFPIGNTGFHSPIKIGNSSSVTNAFYARNYHLEPAYSEFVGFPGLRPFEISGKLINR